MLLNNLKEVLWSIASLHKNVRYTSYGSDIHQLYKALEFSLKCIEELNSKINILESKEKEMGGNYE